MDSVETDKTVRAVSRIGAMLPAHCTAVGKVQLASLSPADVERLYPEMNLPGLTDKSIKTRDALIAELKKTAEKGYALENEECDLEVRGIAVPVKDFSNNVIAAVGIVAPASRLTDERLEKGGIISLLLESGQALSAKLGFNAPAGRK
jgi:DNA-binding IclR family transcriptional regulator